ncbi:TPA: hypothetical protein EYP66_07035 [Candidatus Poribacteria bacterium]|nr:hypothetical protein [Candidatus Poribacteria bacterium]
MKSEKMKRARLCSDCGTLTEFREVTEEYERGGVRIRISGIPANTTTFDVNVTLLNDDIAELNETVAVPNTLPNVPLFSSHTLNVT